MNPSVLGVLETALYVKDLEQAQQFYDELFGFEEAFREEGRLHALKVPGNQILLLFKENASTHPTNTSGGVIPPHDGHGQLHLAFEIEETQITSWRERLAALKVSIESEVDCARGGHSIYFRDPDGHLLELVTRQCWGLT
jgi:catechol 2,3-dioxygenase-like lactoylglutathione lyase family enzyme